MCSYPVPAGQDKKKKQLFERPLFDHAEISLPIFQLLITMRTADNLALGAGLPGRPAQRSLGTRKPAAKIPDDADQTALDSPKGACAQIE